MSKYRGIKKRIDKRNIVVERVESCGFLLGGKKKKKISSELSRYDINSCKYALIQALRDIIET